MLDQSSVKIESNGLERFSGLIEGGMEAGGSGPIRDMFSQWYARYMAFIRRRFTAFSRGGGDWPPLAKSTMQHRRGAQRGNQKAKNGSRSFAILVDTGILRNSLSAGNPGSLFEQIEDGIQMGIGPDAHGKDRITIGDLAIFHHFGMGRLPARKILVGPDEQTMRGMESDALRCAKRLEEMANSGGGGNATGSV